jgi:peptidoglycan/LPS O-acetylase OafA/YrhL
MSPISPLPYFVWMFVYVLLAGLVARSSPFFVAQRTSLASTYNVPLEGLRGVLALSVFFHHAMITYFFLRTGHVRTPLPRFYAHCGTSAVLLFFFLTGFLFWGRVLDRGPPDVTPFIEARARRLVPAYALSFALLLLITGARSGWRLRESLPNVAGEIARWCAFGFLGFPDIDAVPMTRLGNHGVFWTLQWEWVFYLALPWLGWFARDYRIALLGGLLLVAHAASTAAGHDGGIARTLMMGFYPGMLVAHFARAPLASRLGAARGSTLAPVMALGVAVLLPSDSPWVVLPLSIAFASVAIGADVLGLLRHPALVLLGQISYSTYVLHGAVLFAVSSIVNRFVPVANMSPLSFWAMAGAIGLLALIASAASFRFVERPFLRAAVAPRPAVRHDALVDHGVPRAR